MTKFACFLFLSFLSFFPACLSYAVTNQCSHMFGEIAISLPYTEIGGVRLSSAISSNRRLVKEAVYAAKDLHIQTDLNALVDREVACDSSSHGGFGRFAIGKGYYELRSSHGARVYFKNVTVDGIRHVIICGKATKKGSGNDQRVFRIMREVFLDFPEPPKKVNVKK